MKVKINMNGEEKEIKLGVKGKDIKQVLKLVQKMDGSDTKIIGEYIDKVDEIAARASGMTLEELDNLDIEEKDKITTAITDKAMGRLDFTKPSQKQAS